MPSGEAKAEKKPLISRGWSFKKATLTLPIKPTEHVRIVRQFFFCLSLIIVIFVLVLYLLVFRLDEKLVVSQMWYDARRVAGSLKVQWDWALSYDKIYVPIKEAPADSGVDETRVSDGAENYFIKNHRDMTLETAEIAQAQRKFRFQLISALPESKLTPTDNWVKVAFEKIKNKNITETGEVRKDGNTLVFWYLTSIKAEASCLRCHRDEGFIPGKVVGGFVVQIPVSEEYQNIRKSKIAVASLFGGSLVVIFITIILLVLNLSAQLKDAYYHLEQLAREDSLTHLPTRRAFKEFTDLQVALSNRHGWPLTIVIADIDNFKSVNDTYGHKMGDDVLTAFSKILRDNIRCSDVPCRWGGEEFVVALVNTEETNGAKVAEKLLQKFNDLKVPGLDIKLTCSFGITQLRRGETVEDAIARADTALFEVKRAGGNGFRIAQNGVPSEYKVGDEISSSQN